MADGGLKIVEEACGKESMDETEQITGSRQHEFFLVGQSRLDDALGHVLFVECGQNDGAEKTPLFALLLRN